MKRLLAGFALLAFVSSAGAAGIFTGQTVNYQYYFSDLSSPYPVADNGNHAVGAGVEVTNVVAGHGTLDFQDSGFVVSFATSATFSSGAYNGFVVNDVFSTIGSFTSFTLVSNTAFAGTPLFGFDADNLYVNWQGLTFSPGDLVFAVNVAAVPEPETYAMLAAGLGLLGIAARRRKQKELEAV